MLFRNALEEDLPAITSIYNHEIINSTATFDEKEKKLQERKIWFKEHQKSPYMLLVAEQNGKIAGYASLSAYGSKDAFSCTAELSVYVDKDARRLGIGEQLIKEVIKRAKNEGKLHLLISLITSSNQASIALHKKIGFTFCGRINEIARKFGQFQGIDIYTLIL